MSTAEKTRPFDIEKHVRSYVYDEARFAPLKGMVLEKILSYDQKQGTGEVIYKHLVRVAHEAENFLIDQQYDSRVAHIIADAFILHDAGKILQDPALWRVTEEKPNRTAEEKAEREKHTDLGLNVLRQAMDELGFEPTADEKQHLLLIEHLMLRHHDRLPAPLDDVLCILTIIDQIDGKGKAKDLHASFEDMSGAKHGTQFNQDFVKKYRQFCEKNNRVFVHETPPLQPKFER